MEDDSNESDAEFKANPEEESKQTAAREVSAAEVQPFVAGSPEQSKPTPAWFPIPENDLGRAPDVIVT